MNHEPAPENEEVRDTEQKFRTYLMMVLIFIIAVVIVILIASLLQPPMGVFSNILFEDF